jgi:Retroviral aspartyl protease
MRKSCQHILEPTAIITICASNNTTNHNTLQFKGQVGSIDIITMVDSGSTHSFINPSIIQLLSLPITTSQLLTVTTANGSKLSTNQLCVQLKFTLQKHLFTCDLHVLPMAGHDFIFGMDWLHNHSPVEFNSKDGKLTVHLNGKQTHLAVQPVTATLQLCAQLPNLNKEIHKGADIMLAQLFCAEASLPSQPTCPLPVQQHLIEYQKVFNTPSSLPPPRLCDHQINLIPYSKPFTLRPYRFSYFQKLEIEKILEELLANDFIQPSSSAFASPVLLVKKKNRSWRMCVDYRKLNDITIKNKFSIPIIDDSLDELKNACYFFQN